MPELPEVETIKNELTPSVVGRRVTDVIIFWEKMVTKPSPDEFHNQLIGKKIAGLDRRGKYLIFSLSGGGALVIHLRMTGSLLLKHHSDVPEKFVRAIISLDGNLSIHFRDVRKLGKMWLEQSRDAIDRKLGVEPLSDRFTPKYLADYLGKRSAPVKALLIEQSVIAGIGNMYADEALFVARIHPERPGNSLFAEEVARLYQAIREVLTAAIGNKGASVDTYFRPDGSAGTAQSEFRVAHRGGQQCPVCGGLVSRITVRNRGTYFCPSCQHKFDVR
jgi:formamidopyrimidine-DNA glycosylase